MMSKCYVHFILFKTSTVKVIPTTEQQSWYRCKGLGAIHVTDDTADDTCPICDGSGELISDELELTNLDLSSLEHEEINVIGIPDEGEFEIRDGCPECRGEGYLKDREGELYECPECDGTGAGIGYAVEVENSIVGAMMRGRRSLQDGIDPFEDDDEPVNDEDHECPKCHGDGCVPVINEEGLEDIECDVCKGTGILENPDGIPF